MLLLVTLHTALLIHKRCSHHPEGHGSIVPMELLLIGPCHWNSYYGIKELLPLSNKFNQSISLKNRTPSPVDGITDLKRKPAKGIQK